MFNVNDIVELKIEKMVYEGCGLTRKDGFVIFAEGVCDGDLIEAKITKIKKNFANAELIKIIQPSIYRVEPFCPIFNACGGCQWQYIDYNHQLEVKQNIVREILSKTLQREINVEKTLPSPNKKVFRYKVQMPVSQTKNSKRFLIGYYKKGSHEIINNKFCPIQPALVNEITNDIRNEAQKLCVTAFNEHNYKGELRHVIYRISNDNGNILLCFVVNSNKISKEIRDLSERIYNKYEQIIGISVNFNTAKNNVILGEKTENLFGESVYIEKINGIDYVISPDSFFQVNPESFKNILNKVKELVKVHSKDKKPSILDAYSGVGSFGLYLSDIADKITCAEEVENACNNAKAACKLNNINNIEIIHGDAQKIFEILIKEKRKFDFVILDPPRKGCSKESLDYCANLTDKYIVYVSCNPNSLARDLKYLEKYGFEITYAQTVDMFCHTYHVETVTFIEKKHNLG